MQAHGGEVANHLLHDEGPHEAEGGRRGVRGRAAGRGGAAPGVTRAVGHEAAQTEGVALSTKSQRNDVAPYVRCGVDTYTWLAFHA